MNDHNLDDLIIDTIAPKTTKTKNLLTFAALLIIVLIVAIILTKTLLKSPADSELSFEENMSEMIAPELKLQEEKEIAKPKDDVKLSHIIEEKHEVIKEDKEPDMIQKETVSIQKNNVPVEAKKVVEQKPISTHEKIIASPSKPVTQIKPKTVVKKPVKKQTTTPTKPHTPTVGKYYVQVGSFKETPSARFLSVIKSSGFKYHVTNPDRTGYKKLLIGPYKTRAEVDKARDIIRDRIHKSAFVVQK